MYYVEFEYLSVPKSVIIYNESIILFDILMLANKLLLLRS